MPAVQTWPLFTNTPIIEPIEARFMLASENTMFGDLPPSSSDTRFRFPSDA